MIAIANRYKVKRKSTKKELLYERKENQRSKHIYSNCIDSDGKKKENNQTLIVALS